MMMVSTALSPVCGSVEIALSQCDGGSEVGYGQSAELMRHDVAANDRSSIAYRPSDTRITCWLVFQAQAAAKQ